MKFRHGQAVKTVVTLDCRQMGGPLIPKGTWARIKIVRRTGELWCETDGYGTTHFLPKDLELAEKLFYFVVGAEDMQEAENKIAHGEFQFIKKEPA